MDDEETEILEKAEKIRTKIALRKNESRLNKKSLKNRAIIPRTKTRKRISQLENHLKEIGLDSSTISARARGFGYQGGEAALTGEDVVMRDSGEVVPSEQAIWRVKQQNRTAGGLKSSAVLNKVEQVKRSKQRGRNLGGRQGEADRRVTASKPKHMLVGKRKMGKTNRR
jgi:nucleolar GTP-binding protein